MAWAHAQELKLCTRKALRPSSDTILAGFSGFLAHTAHLEQVFEHDVIRDKKRLTPLQNPNRSATF